jgi:hypothetical protein
MSSHEPWTENEWMNWDSLCEAQYVIALRELCDEATEKVKRGR